MPRKLESSANGPIDDAAPAVQVEFQNIGDRHGHSIGIVDQEQFLPVLTSVEGLRENAWPPSPPIQQLCSSTPPQQHVRLGVGMAGKSHWSMSIEPRMPPKPKGYEFDVACRLNGAPEWVGSMYQIIQRSVDSVWIDRGCIGLKTLSGVLHFETLPTEGDRVVMLKLSDDKLRIMVTPQTHQSRETVRWKYSLTFSHESNGYPLEQISSSPSLGS